jgi:hypothetical protein
MRRIMLVTLILLGAVSAGHAGGSTDCAAGSAGCQPAQARAFTTIAVKHFPEATSQFWRAYGHACATSGADLRRLCRTDPERAARRLGLD